MSWGREVFKELFFVFGKISVGREAREGREKPLEKKKEREGRRAQPVGPPSLLQTAGAVRPLTLAHSSSTEKRRGSGGWRS